MCVFLARCVDDKSGDVEQKRIEENKRESSSPLCYALRLCPTGSNVTIIGRLVTKAVNNVCYFVLWSWQTTESNDPESVVYLWGLGFSRVTGHEAVEGGTSASR